MAITHAEFIRSLTPLKKYYAYKLNPDKTIISITDGPRHIEIKLGAESIKRLGSLHMPVSEVMFSFSGFTTTQQSEFWRVFDLSFRRGGG